MAAGQSGTTVLAQLTDSGFCDNLRQLDKSSWGKFMELDVFELSFILVTVVSVLGVAFTLAWIDASPHKDAGLDQSRD